MKMRLLRTSTFVLLASLPLGGSSRSAEESGGPRELPAYQVSDPQAARITAANLLANDRFWPYQVALVEAWRPEPRQRPLPADIAGVLIRVEASGAARIDFGRDGLHTVPLEATDLLARANAVRLGEAEKSAPNLVLDIAPRLLDAGAETLRPYGVRPALAYPRFLCLFADPSAAGFDELATALAPLQQRADVLTVLFPLGSHPDAALRERLRALAWPVPFLLDHLAEPYAAALLPDGMEAPALMLLSNEGRVLLAGPYSEQLVTTLTERLAALAEKAPPEAS
jgi:hypothetical protein